MKNIVRRFDSVFQFTEHLNHAQPNSLWRKIELDSDHADDEGKVGTNSYAEAQTLFAYGDKESMNLIKKTAGRSGLKGNGEFARTSSVLSVVGSMPHIAAYVAGSPRCMIRRTEEKRTSSKVLNILYNCAFPWKASKEDIIKQGVEVLSFVNDAERKGYRCNLYASVFAKKGEESVAMMVRIKSSSQMLDLLKTAYPIINPSFLRRHYFRFLETEPEVTERDWVRSYGRPLSDWKEVEEVLKGQPLKVDYYFNSKEMVKVGSAK